MTKEKPRRGRWRAGCWNRSAGASCQRTEHRHEERRSALKDVERQSRTGNCSQIIIETPYRNDSLFADMLQCLSPGTRVTVAADITLPSQFIRTRTVAAWRKEGLQIGKRPCVFIILA